MHEAEPNFDKYLDQILSSVKIGRREKSELKQEWNQHLLDSLNHLLEKGIPRQQALKMTIQQFGSPELLQQEVNQTYAWTRRQHRLRELAVWLICLIAAAIGPYLLINAYFRLYFITTPVIVLLFCYLSYHLVIKRIPNKISFIVFIPLYAFWIYTYFYGFSLISEVSIANYLEAILPLSWSRLTSNNGLFEFPTLHLFWYVIILLNLLLPLKKKSIFQSLIVSSFQYWGMLTVSLIFAKLADSAEAAVISLNVFLLYAFLQQIARLITLRVTKSIMIK